MVETGHDQKQVVGPVVGERPRGRVRVNVVACGVQLDEVRAGD